MCNFIGQKHRNWIGHFTPYSLGPAVKGLPVHVLSSAKVNCLPWMTVHFALDTAVLRTRISLGIHLKIHLVHDI